MSQLHPLQRFFHSGHPISQFLKIDFEKAEGRTVSVLAEASEAFVSDPASGTIHSGFATLILDSVMGGSVMAQLDPIRPIATAGLTTQHLRRPQKGEMLRCEVVFQGIHADMAHMNGCITNADTDEILSTATGTFMIGTRAKPLGARL